MSTEVKDITRIIACGVFRQFLEGIELEKKYPHIRITYLQSNLHLRPMELRACLLQAVETSRKRNEKVICLYGNCFPGIADFCRESGIPKVSGDFCHEMLLGPEYYRKLIDEITGTYFIEKELIINFENHCMEPLELHDDMMRRYCFEHYQRLVYVRQPADPDLQQKAIELAGFLELSLDVCDSDYASLECELTRIIESRTAG